MSVLPPLPASDLIEFSQAIKSVSLATLNERGEPHISYSPYVSEHLTSLYIFVSGLAGHTANLLRNPMVSVMLIEGEHASAQIFARQRLTMKCDVKPIDRDEQVGSLWSTILTQMEARHGSVVGMLKTLPDFQLFRLDARQVTFVKGFGQAYHAAVEPNADVLPALMHISSEALKNSDVKEKNNK